MRFLLKFIRRSLHTYVPSNFHNPLGLAVRLLRSKDPAALFAMKSSILGFIFTPLDLIFEMNEKKLYKKAKETSCPLIIVVGAPRTGTTLVAQVLINYLPVCFMNNLTSVFPRSPITANLLFRRWIKQKELSYKSYYGKSLHFSGPNDALYIWDRWLERNQIDISKGINGKKKEEMRNFFSAYMHAFQKPMVCKNNSLNVRANLVADILKNAYFICINRDPVYLAQSLLKARIDIHGNLGIAYGIDDPNESKNQNLDPVEDVCRQVIFHEQRIVEQQKKIGTDRFWIISYEDFCKDPPGLVKIISEKILKKPIQDERFLQTLKPFEIANKIKIEPKLFDEIKRVCERFSLS